MKLKLLNCCSCFVATKVCVLRNEVGESQGQSYVLVATSRPYVVTKPLLIATNRSGLEHNLSQFWLIIGPSSKAINICFQDKTKEGLLEENMQRGKRERRLDHCLVWRKKTKNSSNFSIRVSSSLIFIFCPNFMMCQKRNKKSLISAYISPKYHISVDTDTIFIIESWLGKKFRKSLIFQRNIGKYRYFGEISSVYIMCA